MLSRDGKRKKGHPAPFPKKQRAGAVVPHGQILTAIWGDTHAGDVAYLRVHIGRLRQKIEDDPAAPTNLQSRLEKGGSEACYYCANAIFRGTLARMSKTTRQALQPIRPPRHGIDGRDRPDASLSRQIKNTKMHHQFSF